MKNDRNRYRLRHLLVVGFFALLISSCAAGGAEDPPATPRPEQGEVQRGPATSFALPQGDERSLNAQQVLTDGFVTRAEMEQTYLLYIDCLVAGGARGEYAFDLSTGTVGVAKDYWVENDDEDGTRLEALNASCESQVTAIESQYAEDNPPGDKERAIIKDRLLTCLVASLPDQANRLTPDMDITAIYDLMDEIQGTANVSIQDSFAIAGCDNASRVGEWRTFGQ